MRKDFMEDTKGVENDYEMIILHLHLHVTFVHYTKFQITHSSISESH